MTPEQFLRIKAAYAACRALETPAEWAEVFRSLSDMKTGTRGTLIDMVIEISKNRRSTFRADWKLEISPVKNPIPPPPY